MGETRLEGTTQIEAQEAFSSKKKKEAMIWVRGNHQDGWGNSPVLITGEGPQN